MSSDSAPLKVAVIGAGAIGGMFAARLAHAGHTVSMVARGRTLLALQQTGIRLHDNDETITARVNAVSSTEQLDAQDLIIIAVKAVALAEVAMTLKPLLKADTIVLPALNGLPWWYFLNEQLPLAGSRLRNVDPDGRIEACIELLRVIGIVVVAACHCPEPGVVHQAPNGRLVIGEPWGGSSTRLQKMTQVLSSAGFATQASNNIRNDIWLKLLGNACFNPVSLLTCAYTDDMINTPDLYRLFSGMMTESITVGRALGLQLDIDPVARLAQTLRSGHIKSSMLQDLEAGRPVEIDAILGALVEAAQAAGIDAPLAQYVLALVRMRARSAGLYPTVRAS